jgi:hypothetical protein
LLVDGPVDQIKSSYGLMQRIGRVSKSAPFIAPTGKAAAALAEKFGSPTEEDGSHGPSTPKM